MDLKFRVWGIKTASALLWLSLILNLSLSVLSEPIKSDSNGQRKSPKEHQTVPARSRLEYLIDSLYEEAERLIQKDQPQVALEKLQQALVIARRRPLDQSRQYLRDARKLAILNKLGEVYRVLGQYPKALDLHQQALLLYRDLTKSSSAKEDYITKIPTALQVTEEELLNNLAIVYSRQGQYSKAMELFQQALNLIESREDPRFKGMVLAKGNNRLKGQLFNNMGLIQQSLGAYWPAIALQNQALAIAVELEDDYGVATIYNNLGSVYDNLGQYPRALELYQWAHKIYARIGDRTAQATNLNNQALTYDNLKQYDKAIALYHQALALYKAVGTPETQGSTLLNLGSAYRSTGQLSQALTTLKQSLSILKAIGDRSGEGRNLSSLGLVYEAMGQHEQAFGLYNQSLSILRDIGDRPGEQKLLGYIGTSLEKQKKLDLAILFYKQFVNLTEDIRQGLKIFVKKEEVAYTKTIEQTYRDLANLLLQKNRVLEAQQVLDLLKVQELNRYLKNVRGTQQKETQLDILRPEQDILKQYNALHQTAIGLGKELAQLRNIPEGSRTTTQKQRVIELVKLQEDLNRQFNAFIDSPSIVSLVDQLDDTTQRQNVDLADLNALRNNLRRLNAVLIYPLILGDRLELIITTPDSAPLRRTVSLKQVDLNQAIVSFRRALQDPTSDIEVKQMAQQLYGWLLKPLEADLKQAKVETIIYAPDGVLRYIPLAALHDGHQWVVERYRINHITARSLSEFDQRPTAALRILAGAFTKGTFQVKVGDRNLSFQGLPFAGREVQNLVAALPGTTALLDSAFSLAATTTQMGEYPIVHLATHAAFVVGQPEESFILFGNGDRATLRDIQNWSLQNVELVVLSACETALGGQFGNGEEILGLGYQFQRAGAKAAIASLWKVDDESTQTLMNALYGHLKQRKVTKTEALRQAQLSLIQGKELAGQHRGSIVVQPKEGRLSTQKPDRLSHPYYWAPFILIGNGL
jgi:CHAT domain-containing protein/tetratricopeptide (TPR) repeat protein